ncbi:MFS transporter [Microbispora bryophytorum]|uniref:MFS transporter n=1 Tax=Microbispora bryophytorum TaxID=1460882 RepID=A0A8H9GXS0_9ACTN|nr:MFS transporter [Microbispora bryophytorum]MBD3137273.1 MFS transporter [Microbispora bryophytorum]TQS06733.1 MFS transporter [Microbispora bryophytorum]GGO07770.1 MFS transporter [Microbispora bryophytorum]
MALSAPALPALLRARVAVYGLFLLAGMAIGTWTSRIPAIKADLRLSDGALSLGLLGIAAGAITGMQVVGRLVDRYGSYRIMLPMAVAQGLVLVVPAYMPGLPALALSLFAFGAVNGTLDVAMNANAVVVERASGKSMMSSFHAVFSVGGFAGAAAGGMFAHAGTSPGVTFAAMGAVIMIIALLSARWAMRDVPAREAARAGSPDAGPARRRVGGGVLLLGVLAFCCMIGEGAAADWGSVYLRDSLGSSPGFAAAAYAAFSIMMTAGRFAGDRLAAWLGPVTLVRCCGALAGAGLAAGIVAGDPVAGVVGFGLFGAGLSCIIPQVFSAAGHRDPAQSGRALAAVASLGYTGFLAGPVLIGGLAEAVTLPHALLVPAVLALFVAFTAPVMRSRRPEPASEPMSGPASGRHSEPARD